MRLGRLKSVIRSGGVIVHMQMLRGVRKMICGGRVGRRRVKHVGRNNVGQVVVSAVDQDDEE